MKLNVKRILTTLSPLSVKYRSLHDVRVRFAPSPTGYLHLGGLRTALYNYLFALKNNGKFILRIEDTDQTRLVAGATKSIIDDLRWSGIVVDEGPTVGGNFGPYVQSERLPIYNEAVQQLIEDGSAYRCYCSQTRLDLLRKEALKQRQIPKYDNKCRHLKQSDIQDKLSKGVPFCVRFKLDDYNDPVQDLVYGNVFVNSSKHEGDPIIIKSDGYPTYHFANVVDDHYMEVTHVFRGVEWQISTPKHLLLYKAFGWNPPKYGHLPLLINADGTKLSKRQGDISIKSFRESGVFSLALVNYVMCAGGGFHKEQSTKPSLETLESLSKMFNIENLNSHPGRLNPDLLNDFNNLEIRRKLSDENETDELIKTVRGMVRSKYPERNIDLETPYLKSILKWSAERLSNLSDLTSDKFNFLWTDGSAVNTKELTKGKTFKLNNIYVDCFNISICFIDQILELLDSLEKIEFSKTNIQTSLKSYSGKAQIKFPVLMKILRTSLSGLKEGPGVAEVMEIFGKDESLRRIRSNLNSSSI
ncbi:probable glutamate--tRNA ligase, mitochondrial [Eupeodes corollae]|uniref:probable glutamate--tRNA ligase, mitochondrial n=1 Tax=Eupeodes corollae TaxID=290404 RepID=UPI002491AB26|nr:probable glutamate--tRNA ligase, mitochondrial [Eupeodes corollae]